MQFIPLIYIILLDTEIFLMNSSNYPLINPEKNLRRKFIHEMSAEVCAT